MVLDRGRTRRTPVAPGRLQSRPCGLASRLVPLDLDDFLRLPRLSGLAVTPQGAVLVHEGTLDPAGTAFATAIWRLPVGGAPPERLTLPRKGAALAGVLPDSSLLLRVEREDPTAAEDAPDSDTAALWLLPAAGGEARRLCSAPAGIGTVAVARDVAVVVCLADVFPGAADLEADREKAKRRKEVGTQALWFDGYPVREWDHHLAPRAPRLFLVDADTGELRDLTGDVGRALDEAAPVLTPDGSTVVTSWQVDLGRGVRQRDLVTLDVASGQRRTLGSLEHARWSAPAVSPDGRSVACLLERRTTPEQPASIELWLVGLRSGDGAARRLAAGLDRWPQAPLFTADSAAVLFTADDEGHCSLFRVPVDGAAQAVRLARVGAYADVAAAPDGSRLLALRSTVTTPPEVVELDPAESDQEPVVLHTTAPEAPWGTRVDEVEAGAPDGSSLRAWLVLPAASPPAEPVEPAPLAVFIHGGPLASWNAWSWRWQPLLLAARGYAVLLPDPALSTGYGTAHIARGWQEWGGAPYDDVLALTDAATARADVDADSTAVLGGSYGGYLTNWVVGHTDRFRCAVTHASLWELTGFQGTTDDATAWSDWFGDPVQREDFYRHWSPHTYADAVTTPMLVIHGEQDHRVPVGEGLRLWSDLQRRGVESALLYFPDENHWVLQPGNTRVWYDAVLGWLEEHLRGGGPARPGLV